jgi:transposase
MPIGFTPSYFESLVSLSPEEQSQVNVAVHTFMKDRSNASLGLHACTKGGISRGRNLWSISASRGLRIILHKEGDKWTFVRAGQHDVTYRWIERRKIVPNGDTMSVVEEEVIKRVIERERIVEHVRVRESRTFGGYTDEYLLALGVPEEWLAAVRQVRTDEDLYRLCDKLPEEVADRLLTIASGEFELPERDSASDDRELALLIRGRIQGGQTFGSVAPDLDLSPREVENIELLLDFPEVEIGLEGEFYDEVDSFLEYLSAPSGVATSSWSGFTTWCARYGFSPLPACAEVVSLFLADLARRCRLDTVRFALQQISHEHEKGCFVRPSESLLVVRLLEGIKTWNGSEELSRDVLSNLISKRASKREMAEQLGVRRAVIDRELRRHRLTTGITREVLEELAAEGLTRKQMAERLGAGYTTVCAALKRYGDIEVAKPTWKKTVSRGELQELISEGLDRKAMAKRLGVKYSFVCEKVREYGIELPSVTAARRVDPDEILAMAKRGMARKQMAAELGIPYDRLNREIREHGLEIKSAGKKQFSRRTLKPMFEAGMSQVAMAKKLGSSPQTVKRELARHGLLDR